MVSHEGLDALVEAVTGALASGTRPRSGAGGGAGRHDRRARAGRARRRCPPRPARRAHDVRQGARTRRHGDGAVDAAAGRGHRGAPRRTPGGRRCGRGVGATGARAGWGAVSARLLARRSRAPRATPGSASCAPPGSTRWRSWPRRRTPPLAVARARAAGLGVQVIAIDLATESRLGWLLDARRLADAAGGITAVAPLPRQLDRATPTTGFDDVRTVALARLILTDGAQHPGGLDPVWAQAGAGRPRCRRRRPRCRVAAGRRGARAAAGRGGGSPAQHHRRRADADRARRPVDGDGTMSARVRVERGLVSQRQTAGPGARSPARPLRSLLRPAVHLRRPAARRRGRPGVDSRRRVPGRRLPVRARHRDRLRRADALGRGVHHRADRADPTPGARHQLAHLGGAVPHPVREALGDRARVRRQRRRSWPGCSASPTPRC